MHMHKNKSRRSLAAPIRFIRKDVRKMNVYDTANKLAQEIKQSEEYITYKTAKEAISLNVELKKQIEEFEKARYDAQIVALQTGKDDSEKIKHVQELYSQLIQNQEASRYFDAEVKFNVMIADINKIIGEAIQSVL